MIYDFCKSFGISRYWRKYSGFDIDICICQRVWWLTYAQWQDLFNVIIHLVGRRHPWITGTGVCSNSIECATNTSRKFALAQQLDSLCLWCSFRQRCTSPFNPPLSPAATGGRVRELVATMTASILRPVLQSSARFATLSCYRINANEWWWWRQTYMRHSGNDPRLTGHSWRRPVTA